MSNLYVYEQGSVVNYEQNRIQIKEKTGEEHSIPIESIDNIVMFGGIQVTTNCIQNLLQRGVHLTWLSNTGSYYGRLDSTSHINIDRQRLQFRKSDDPTFCLELAKQFIKGKTTNQRTVLVRYNRYLQQDQMQFLLSEMAKTIQKIDQVQSIPELMGLEGLLAKQYYKGLNLILSPEFSFEKRTKRPPKDPFNAILSFGYTLLHYEVFTTVASKGLNPYAAFLHSDRHKHPALCSDLLEEWRPILVDSLAISLVNNNKITADMFDYHQENAGVYLQKEACKKFVAEFEKRLRQEVSYITEIPYKMSFRRIIEYQVMQLIKSLENDRPRDYKPVLIR